MKTITLQEVYQILEDCSGIVTEDHVITYPSLADLTGEDDNQWLNISWIDEGQDFDIVFIEENNKEIKVSGSSMFLEDEDGDEFQITVLVPQNLEQTVFDFAK